MTKTIKQTWHFDQPLESVWDFFTNSELLAQWLMENDFKPIVGHKFMFHTRPRPGFDGKVFCEVLEIDPFKKIMYSWKGGPAPGKISLDSTVTWTFTANSSGTDVQLEHAGFKVMKNYMAYIFMGSGWATKIRKRLTELLNQASHEKAHS